MIDWLIDWLNGGKNSPHLFWKWRILMSLDCSIQWIDKRGQYRVLSEEAWVSGVSGGKGERWKRKRERAEGEKRLTQMLLLEPSTPTQHDSIPSDQNHFRSLRCQLHVSKSSPKINLTLRSGRPPMLVLLRFRFFLKPPMRSFRYL